MIDLIGDRDPWIAATSGERLLFLLLRRDAEWRRLADTLTGTRVGIARRFEGLANFFVGASVLYTLQRMIRLAHDVRQREPEDRLRQLELLQAGLRDVIQISLADYAGDFDELTQETLLSGEQTRRNVGTTLKRRVLGGRFIDCYSCGRPFGTITKDGPAPAGLVATADHVWPRALGGDTVEENLLAACEQCNSHKGHLATWQMAWIQVAVFSESDVDEFGGLKGLRKDSKFGLHIRAAMAYANANGSTLKDAFIAIGARVDPPVRIDPEQGYDFFNLRVHDEAATGIAWMPA